MKFLQWIQSTFLKLILMIFSLFSKISFSWSSASPLFLLSNFDSCNKHLDTTFTPTKQHTHKATSSRNFPVILTVNITFNIGFIEKKILRQVSTDCSLLEKKYLP